MYKHHSKADWGILPVILAAGFVPLIVHQFDYRTHLEVFDWFPDSAAYKTDFFLAYKSFFIIALGIVMLAVLFRKLQKGQTQSPAAAQAQIPAYLLAAYAALVLLSGICSPYRSYAFRGGYEIFEPVWTVLAYVLFCWYTYSMVKKDGQVFRILHWSGIGILLVTLIGVFQYFGLDFFRTGFGKMLITNPSYWSQLEAMSFTFPKGTVYTTLYNVDYLSFYYGLLFPVLIGMFFAANRLWLRILYLVAAAGFALCLAGSGAVSGFLGLAASAMLFVYLLLSRRRSLFIAGIAAGAVLLAAGAGFLFCTDSGKNLWASVAGTSHLAEDFLVEEIDTGDDSIVFTIKGGGELELSYSFDENGYFLLQAWDGDENSVGYSASEDMLSYKLEEGAWGDCTVSPVDFGDCYGISVTLDGIGWNFTNETGDGGYYYLNPAGKYTKMQAAESAELFYDGFFSGRGPIWNRTLPLLKKYLLLGAGANNYALAHPQADYVYSAYTGSGTIYDVKAHCWLLQQWVENGLPAMLCLIGFYLWYFVRSVQIYRKAYLQDGVAPVGLGIFLGSVAYMVVSLANDSNVCTAPVFWVLMGLGMAVNRMVVSAMETESLSPAPAGQEEPPKQEPSPKQGQKPQPAKKQSRKKRKR